MTVVVVILHGFSLSARPHPRGWGRGSRVFVGLCASEIGRARLNNKSVKTSEFVVPFGVVRVPLQQSMSQLSMPIRLSVEHANPCLS